jgi:hypothetical protein
LFSVCDFAAIGLNANPTAEFQPKIKLAAQSGPMPIGPDAANDACIQLYVLQLAAHIPHVIDFATNFELLRERERERERDSVGFQSRPTGYRSGQL